MGRREGTALLGGILIVLVCAGIAFGLGWAATDGFAPNTPVPTPARPTATTAPAPTPTTDVRPFSEDAPEERAGGTLGAGAPAPAATDLTPVEVVERVASAVVTVINRQEVSPFGSLEPAGAGTGFIIDAEGHIVTNQRVVAGGDALEVIFADGEKRPARLVGQDPISDLAVVQVEGDLPGIVPLGDSSTLQPGQRVLAIGSPLGAFTNTVTRGIVSALGRSLSAQPGRPELTGLIQHDAAINPGNLGGPLFNLRGEVVGVNTLGIAQTASGQPAQGLSFAVPSNTVKEIAAKLIADGEVRYPYFGVTSAPVTKQIAAQEDLPVDYGVYVLEVAPGGPAAKAGVRAGDIVLSIDGERVDARTSFTEVLFRYEPGQTVEALIQRGNEERTVRVTLGVRPPS